jgi:proliferating cell nuclear antigen
MKLRTIQAVAIKSVFEVLKDIINDVNLYFDEDGVHIIALDIARTALVHMTLASENFEEYDCTSRVIAGMNMANTYKLLKSVTNNDTLEMSITTGETLEIIVQNQTKRSSSKFNLKLLDIDEDLLESPDLDTDIITTFPAVDFQRICRDMGNLADDISIFRDGNMLELSCRGDFADQSTSIECPDDIEGRVGNTFSLKYINLFTKATSMCSSVQLLQNSQDDSLPIILRYTIANLGDMKFYLSAKATDNDEI